MVFCFIKWYHLLSSNISKALQNIEQGNHDDKVCEKYHNDCKCWIGQEQPDCEYKGNKFKIQKLIRKVHIDANGGLTKVQFDNKPNDEDVKWRSG